MKKSVYVGLLLMLGLFSVGSWTWAAEPTISQVYQAAEAGKLDEAQQMMREVLRAHPDSAKAHFVEAELLAKQGQRQKAQGELARAETLSPGLGFAKPQSVQELKSLLGESPAVRSSVLPVVSSGGTRGVMGSTGGLILIGVGLVAFIAVAARFMSRRAGQNAPGGYDSQHFAYGTPRVAQPDSGYGAANPVTYGTAAPGMGSRVLGGLATGAALGAGVVAGEALMHRIMGGTGETGGSASHPAGFGLVPSDADLATDDLGGSDFGISDAASWDDNSSGSDWS